MLASLQPPAPDRLGARRGDSAIGAVTKRVVAAISPDAGGAAIAAGQGRGIPFPAVDQGQCGGAIATTCDSGDINTVSPSREVGCG
jgi:hypothetical protein